MTDFALESVIRQNIGFVPEGLRKRTFCQRGPLDLNLGAEGRHCSLAGDPATRKLAATVPVHGSTPPPNPHMHRSTLSAARLCPTSPKLPAVRMLLEFWLSILEENRCGRGAQRLHGACINV
jgi:hypothetical protein